MGIRKNKWQMLLKQIRKASCFAKLKQLSYFAKKMRLVADLVRGQKAEKALQILRFSPKEASKNLKSFYFLQLPIGKLRMRMLILNLLIYL